MNSSPDPFSSFQVVQIPPLLQAIRERAAEDVHARRSARPNVKGKHTYYPVKTAITDDALVVHLTGGNDCAGFYLGIQGESVTRIAVIDIDDHGNKYTFEDLKGKAKQIAAALRKTGFRVNIVTSGSGHGFHLIILFNRPQSAAAVRSRVSAPLAVFQEEGLIEIFPKQDSVKALGNLVAYPFGRKSVAQNQDFEPVDKMTMPVLISDDVQGGTVPVSPVFPSEIKGKDLNAEFLGGLEEKEQVNTDKLKSALDAIPCGKPYRLFIETGMALYTSLGDAGLAIWHYWCSKYDGYDPVELDTKWATFGSCENPLTVASIYKRAIDAGWEWNPDNKKVNATTSTQIKTMAELLNTTFSAIRWVIFGLLPEGLAILSGAPKIGKSWMVMNLCLAVSWGGYIFGKFKVEMAEVLLLSLEDNERRLKGRLKICMAGENKDLSKFHATTVWKRLDQGGLEDLASWLELHPNCRLVVIDTMQKIKAHPKRKNGNAYENDYDSYGDLQRLALHHRCCILVIHHNRKSDSKNDGDPLEAISGSTGVTGSMDTILMLSRPRGATGSVLTATGRDISEAEYAMNFDGNLGQWVVTGKAEEAVLHDGSNASHILEFMKTRPGDAFTAKDIFERMEGKIKLEGIKTELYRLAIRKIIVNNRGKFAYHVTIETALPVLPVTFDNPSTHANDTRISNARKSAPKRPHQPPVTPVTPMSPVTIVTPVT